MSWLSSCAFPALSSQNVCCEKGLQHTLRLLGVDGDVCEYALNLKTHHHPPGLCVRSRSSQCVTCMCMTILTEARSVTTTIVLIVAWHFPFSGPSSIQWYSWSGTDSPPAALVGICAAVPRASLTTCSLCRLGRGPKPVIETLGAAAEWANTQVAKYIRHDDTQTHILMQSWGQNPQSQISTHAHVHIRPQTHIDALWHSKMGRGAASAGAKQWTAFEPATSVTHPYWCQAEHSLTTQRFSKHSVAPGTVGVNGGKGGGGRGRRMDGWRDEWMDGGLTHGWKILPVKVLWWNNKETVRDSLQYVMPSRSV